MTCVLCGAKPLVPDPRGTSHALMRCPACGLTQASASTDAKALYSRAYEPGGSYGGYARSQIAAIKSGRVPIGWAHRQFFAAARQGGRVLDVGCGSGAFLVAARHRGWQGTGFELSSEAALLARRELQLEVLEGSLDHSCERAGFDAVTAWEVLEHVPDPVAFARSLRRALAPGGMVALSTPDWASGWSRQLCPDLPQAWPPIHVTFWSAGCLARLLADAGFSRIVVVRKPWAGFYEMGGRRDRWTLLRVLAASVLLRRRGGQLFARAYAGDSPAAGATSR